MAGESAPEPVPNPGSSTKGSDHGSATGGHVNAPRPADTTPGTGASDFERWLANLENSLSPEEKAKLAKMTAGKTAQQTHDMFAGDLGAARERIRTAVRLDQERAAVAAQSKDRVADLRQQITDRDLVNDPEIRKTLEGDLTNPNERIPMLRDKLVVKILQAEAVQAHPAAKVLDGVKVYEKLPEKSIDEWKAKNPNKSIGGLTERDDGLYMQRGEIDMIVVAPQPSGKAKVIAREEIKTGARDTNANARNQLGDQTRLLRDAAAGAKVIRLESGGHDITSQIDLASDAAASKSTRGPAGKGFDKSLGVTAGDLETLCKDLAKALAAGKDAP